MARLAQSFLRRALLLCCLLRLSPRHAVASLRLRPGQSARPACPAASTRCRVRMGQNRTIELVPSGDSAVPHPAFVRRATRMLLTRAVMAIRVRAVEPHPRPYRCPRQIFSPCVALFAQQAPSITGLGRGFIGGLRQLSRRPGCSLCHGAQAPPYRFKLVTPFYFMDFVRPARRQANDTRQLAALPSRRCATHLS